MNSNNKHESQLASEGGYSTSSAEAESTFEQAPATKNDEAVNIFIGKKSSYYRKQWSKNNFAWNWAACFGGLFWLAYRKMYLYTFIYLAMIVIWVFCDTQFELPGSSKTGINASIMALFGGYGNYLYRFYVEKKVEKITQMFNSEHVNSALARQGGTSVGAPIGFFVLGVALIYYFN